MVERAADSNPPPNAEGQQSAKGGSVKSNSPSKRASSLRGRRPLPNFLHENIRLRSGQQQSAQGCVFFVTTNNDSQMVLKNVSL